MGPDPISESLEADPSPPAVQTIVQQDAPVQAKEQIQDEVPVKPRPILELVNPMRLQRVWESQPQ